jgi:hypothetical protein
VGHPLFDLAAAAVIVAAATAVVAAQQAAIATAVAQQQDDQNDPANITAAETVIVTHNQIPPKFVAVNHRSFQDIPQQKKGSGNYFQRPSG